MHHRVLIVGGGTAGITVAARLRRAGVDGVAVLEPSGTHYYQPLWTLVGGGRARARQSARLQSSVIPRGVAWIKDSATGISPGRVDTASGAGITYDRLVVCPGIGLDWDKVPGMADAARGPAASSNYAYDLAPKTWRLIRSLRSGTAVFTMPSGPIKCAGAPQKIAYLAADHWRRRGVLKDIRVILALPTPALFGVPEFAAELERVVARYGIEARTATELTGVKDRTLTLTGPDGAEDLPFDLLHAVPPQSPPAWLGSTSLVDEAGYVEVDRHTLQHVRDPHVFALGDAASTPNSKTGAAVRKQAPVVVENLLASLKDRPLQARYDGYASCPLTTARNKVLLAEFDYTMRPAPTFPVINTTKERRDMWLLKRHGLPALYWNLMLKGLA